MIVFFILFEMSDFTSPVLNWTTCQPVLSGSCILSVTYRKQIKWPRTRSLRSLPPPHPQKKRVVQQSCPAEVGGGFGFNNCLRLTSFTAASRPHGGHLWGPQSSHSQEKRRSQMSFCKPRSAADFCPCLESEPGPRDSPVLGKVLELSSTFGAESANMVKLYDVTEHGGHGIHRKTRSAAE